MDEQEFQRLLKEHNEVLLIADKLDKKLLTEKQKNAFKMIEDDFFDNLDVDEDGNVKMSLKNLEVLNRIDDAFSEFNKSEGSKMLKQFTSNVSNIVKSNAKYFSALDGQAKVLPILPKVTKAMSGWLGIDGGKIKQNGFIEQLISSDSAKVAVKNVAMKIIIGQQGLSDSKKQLKELIEGNPEKLGLFEKHYRTFAVDMNAQIDRATSNVIRTDLNLKFAIYAGGLVEKSRIFCEEHNGKIYHISEILKFNPEVAIPPNYEPISDLGGYNCRHHLRWISKAMAKAKGKDVEAFEDVVVKPVKEEKEKVKPEPKPKPKEKEKIIPEKVKLEEKGNPKKEDFISDKEFVDGFNSLSNGNHFSDYGQRAFMEKLSRDKNLLKEIDGYKMTFEEASFWNYATTFGLNKNIKTLPADTMTPKERDLFEKMYKKVLSKITEVHSGEAVTTIQKGSMLEQAVLNTKVGGILDLEQTIPIPFSGYYNEGGSDFVVRNLSNQKMMFELGSKRSNQPNIVLEKGMKLKLVETIIVNGKTKYIFEPTEYSNDRIRKDVPFDKIQILKTKGVLTEEKFKELDLKFQEKVNNFQAEKLKIKIEKEKLFQEYQKAVKDGVPYKEYKLLIDKYNKTANKYIKKGNEEETIAIDVFIELMKEKPSNNVKLFAEEVKNPNLKKGLEFFNKMVSKYDIGDIGIAKAKTVNGYARESFATTKARMNLVSKTDLSTILHELTHYTEQNNFILKQAVNFLETRTAGQEMKYLKDLNKAYRDNEIYKEGKFHDAYVGKFYEDKRFKNYNGLVATEILTMGIQRMVKNPSEFYRNDKEYFELIYKLFIE